MKRQLLVLACLLTAAASRPSPPPVVMGIQAWSEHVAIERDLAEGYRRLASYGVKPVELYGLDGDGWHETKKQVRTNNLIPIAAHVSVDALANHGAEMVLRARKMGVRYLGLAWLKSQGATPGGLTVAEADRATAAFNGFCRLARKAGITPFLHLHGYEFVRDPDGAGTMLDRLLAKVPARCMAIEIDVFWVVRAGQDPMALLRRYGRRVVFLHLKQPVAGMPVDDSGGIAPGHETALGEGPVEWTALLAEARRQGVRAAFIEDETGDPAANLPRSIAYLRSIGAIR